MRFPCSRRYQSDLAISTVKGKLKETDDWRVQTNLMQDQILVLLSFVL